MKEKPKKVIVSHRALLARINRKLASEDRTVRKCRAGSVGHEFHGDYYEVDTYKNTIVDTHIDLEERAKALDVLKGYEALEQ